MTKKIVGIDTSPLYTDHQVRGVGFYTKRLITALKALNPDGVKIKELKNKRQIKAQNYDSLHIPYFQPYFWTLPFRIKKPWIITIHDLIPIKYPQHYPPGIKAMIRWQIQKLWLKKAKFVITDSFASKYDIHELTGYRQDKIFVTYLAADPKFKKLQVANNKYHLPDIFCLYVGDVNWNKNLPTLIKACEKIRLPIVIVGKQAVSKKYDKNHIENKDLVWLQKKSKKSRFLNLLGFVSTKDLISLYNLATVYCQPSHDEGFGLPVLEAMQSGCPVVSSNLSSLPEVVGDAGILVKPNVKSLSEALKKVISNKKLQDKLSKQGIAQAKLFSWQQTAQKTLNVYKMALI